jgi:DNA-binding MarR family transcriptional regulator
MTLGTSDAIKILSGIQRIDPEMPLQQALCLFVIAEAEDGLSLTDLAKKVGIALATASRYVGALGKMNRHHTAGLNFIESHEDPMERRKKVIKITIKGKSALRTILGENHADIQTRKEFHGVGRER